LEDVFQALSEMGPSAVEAGLNGFGGAVEHGGNLGVGLLVYPAIYYIWRSHGIKRLPPSATAEVPIAQRPASAPAPA
jgi:hypothetical protein